jgi:hypothetical protein
VPATLSQVEGQVLLDGQPAQAGAAIQPGQQLQAGPDSSAVIQLGDGSRASLPPQSAVTLAQHQRYTLKAAQAVQDEGLYAATLRLLRGTLEVLATQAQRAKPLEVTTPTAVIGVRGTRYRVHADAQQPRTQTEVLEGRVWARNQAQPPASPSWMPARAPCCATTSRPSRSRWPPPRSLRRARTLRAAPAAFHPARPGRQHPGADRCGRGLPAHRAGPDTACG